MIKNIITLWGSNPYHYPSSGKCCTYSTKRIPIISHILYIDKYISKYEKKSPIYEDLLSISIWGKYCLFQNSSFNSFQSIT